MQQGVLKDFNEQRVKKDIGRDAVSAMVGFVGLCEGTTLYGRSRLVRPLMNLAIMGATVAGVEAGRKRSR